MGATSTTLGRKASMAIAEVSSGLLGNLSMQLPSTATATATALVGAADEGVTVSPTSVLDRDVGRKSEEPSVAVMWQELSDVLRMILDDSLSSMPNK
jgi:hypothetical protein